MYITVLGSRPNAIPSNVELVRNAAGFSGIIISSFYFDTYQELYLFVL